MVLVRFFLIFLAACLFVSPQASAQFNPPRTFPAAPVAGEPFLVEVDLPYRHAFIVTSPGQVQPRTEIDGSIVRVYHPGTIDLFGVSPINGGTVRIAGATLPEGQYRLEVYMIRFPQLTEMFLSASTIEVRGGAPAPRVVPAQSWPSMLMLLLVLALLAWLRLRNH